MLNLKSELRYSFSASSNLHCRNVSVDNLPEDNCAAHSHVNIIPDDLYSETQLRYWVEDFSRYSTCRCRDIDPKDPCSEGPVFEEPYEAEENCLSLWTYAEAGAMFAETDRTGWCRYGGIYSIDSVVDFDTEEDCSIPDGERSPEGPVLIDPALVDDDTLTAETHESIYRLGSLGPRTGLWAHCGSWTSVHRLDGEVCVTSYPGRFFSSGVILVFEGTVSNYFDADCYSDLDGKRGRYRKPNAGWAINIDEGWLNPSKSRLVKIIITEEYYRREVESVHPDVPIEYQPFKEWGLVELTDEEAAIMRAHEWSHHVMKGKNIFRVEDPKELEYLLKRGPPWGI